MHSVYDGEYDVTASGPVSSCYWQRLIKFFKSVAGFHWTFSALILLVWWREGIQPLEPCFTYSPCPQNCSFGGIQLNLWFNSGSAKWNWAGSCDYPPAYHSGASWMFSAASVCQFVSLFVNTITSEWLNLGWWNLVVRCTVQKSCPSSNLGSKVKITRDKKRKSAAVCSGVVLWSAVFVRHFFSGAVLGGVATSVRTSAHWYRIGWNLLSSPSASYMLLYILILGI